jgi:hypothetical protein
MKLFVPLIVLLVACALLLQPASAATTQITIDRLTDQQCWQGCWRVVEHRATTDPYIRFETLTVIADAPAPWNAIMDVELNTSPELGYNIHLSATPGAIEMYPWAFCDRDGQSRVTLRMGITGYEYPSEVVRGPGLDCDGWSTPRGVDLVWEWLPPVIFLPMVGGQ